MKGTRAAKRYAGALLGLALEMKKVDRLAADMRFIRDSILASRELAAFFKTPIIDHFKKRETIRALYEKRVDELSLRFMLLLVDKGREALMSAIAVEFNTLLDQHLGIVNAELRAPFQFDDEERSHVQSKLEQIVDKKIRISFSLDKSLVGGFVAQIGDTVYDGSVKRQLEILRRQLAEGNERTFEY
jgi:F-type H+-transporting ATPase subunit delta